MADFHVYRDRLEIRLSRAEKALALRRDDLVIPREQIKQVSITADPWIWIRGVRAPGNIVPLTLAVGTWKFHGGKDFLVLKGKARSAVVVDIEQPETSTSTGSTPIADAPAGTKRRGVRFGRRARGTDAEASGEAIVDAAEQDAAGGGRVPAAPVADGFSRVIVSTLHASRLVEALRSHDPDAPVDEIIT
jgi:hypothetical protein